MPMVPEFDENGLWFYQNISFPKHGNLKQTVVYLNETSPSGLTGRQIGETPRSFMHHFRNVPDIKREKQEGVYVYFSREPGRYKQQLQNMSADVEKPISNVHAILILISVIKHYGITILNKLRQQPLKRFNISDKPLTCNPGAFKIIFSSHLFKLKGLFLRRLRLKITKHPF